MSKAFSWDDWKLVQAIQTAIQAAQKIAAKPETISTGTRTEARSGYWSG